MKSYEELLEKGIKELPETAKTTFRYEVSKARGHVEGNKTIITNFNQIVDMLGKDEQRFLKYILKELATPGKVEGGRLTLGRKLGSSLINAKIESYAKTFVLCYDCGKPDTKLEEQNGALYIKCAACGAKHQVKLR